MKFEQTRKGSDTLSIAIVWIGFVLNLEAKHELDEELRIVRPDFDRDGQNMV